MGNPSKIAPSQNDGGGSTFRQMAARFQANFKKTMRNNVWGNFLQEETLNTEMTGIGVGRTLKDISSDRGAETYDYIAAASSSTSAPDHTKVIMMKFYYFVQRS